MFTTHKHFVTHLKIKRPGMSSINSENGCGANASFMIAAIYAPSIERLLVTVTLINDENYQGASICRVLDVFTT